MQKPTLRIHFYVNSPNMKIRRDMILIKKGAGNKTMKLISAEMSHRFTAGNMQYPPSLNIFEPGQRTIGADGYPRLRRLQ